MTLDTLLALTILVMTFGLTAPNPATPMQLQAAASLAEALQTAHHDALSSANEASVIVDLTQPQAVRIIEGDGLPSRLTSSTSASRSARTLSASASVSFAATPSAATQIAFVALPNGNIVMGTLSQMSVTSNPDPTCSKVPTTVVSFSAVSVSVTCATGAISTSITWLPTS